MARMKAVVDKTTGAVVRLPLTPEEEAQADAEELAYLNDPARLARVAKEQLRLDAKASAMFSTLKNATLAEINTWVETNFPGPTFTNQQQNFLKLLAAAAALYLKGD